MQLLRARPTSLVAFAHFKTSVIGAYTNKLDLACDLNRLEQTSSMRELADEFDSFHIEIGIDITRQGIRLYSKLKPENQTRLMTMLRLGGDDVQISSGQGCRCSQRQQGLSTTGVRLQMIRTRSQ